MTEKYNLEATNGGKESVSLKKGEWIIDIYAIPGCSQWEYAPASDFYKIQKQYHPNGFIRFRCKFLGDVPFGSMEYYDEKGVLIKTVNADEKFGMIKPEDLVRIIEEVGWINRRTGENIFTKEPLPTDGSFYMELESHLQIQFVPASVNDGKEIPPTWLFSRLTGTARIYYSVDGNTGEYQYFERRMMRLR